MRHLRLVAVHGRPVDVEGAGDGSVLARYESCISSALWDLLQAPGGDGTTTTGTQDRMETSRRTLDQQLEQIKKMAEQHYPDDLAAQSAYRLEKVIEKLREYEFRFQALPVKEMR